MPYRPGRTVPGLTPKTRNWTRGSDIVISNKMTLTRKQHEAKIVLDKSQAKCNTGVTELTGDGSY